ncbi:MAG: ABC transporter permease subunit, partial [Terriglobales bacterium]
MSLPSVLIQFLNGLAGASSLFLIAAGLSLIFGVTRIVNFAHGSLYVLGMYLAVWLADRVGFWLAVPMAVAGTALLGVFLEVLLLRRIYRAPELLQLLATFALVLLFRDFALWAWGPEDLLGPRAPGLRGAVEIAGQAFPQYDLFLIVVGPLVFAGLYFILKKTRWGILVRAATQDREMAGALGVNERLLFTAVFTLGAALAGLGGALAIPREPASQVLDLAVVSDAFVVVVVGGLGSIPGAFLAALLIGEVKAFCIGLGYSKLTLAVEFIVMAMVLVARPWGLLGKPQAAPRAPAAEPPLPAFPKAGFLVVAAALFGVPALGGDYALVLIGDMLVFALFAVSLHVLIGPGGMLSFGHAAGFGLGAYGAAVLALRAGVPMELALAAAPL